MGFIFHNLKLYKFEALPIMFIYLDIFDVKIVILFLYSSV